MADIIEVTREGYEEFQRELDERVNVIAPKINEAIEKARSQGDLSENADYDAAREEQGKNFSRINELKEILKNAKIIEQKSGKTIGVGSIIEFKDLSDNKTYRYTLVGPVESDPFAQKVSTESPFGKAVRNHKVGDVVTVLGKNPYEIKILKLL